MDFQTNFAPVTATSPAGTVITGTSPTTNAFQTNFAPVTATSPAGTVITGTSPTTNALSDFRQVHPDIDFGNHDFGDDLSLPQIDDPIEAEMKRCKDQMEQYGYCCPVGKHQDGGGCCGNGQHAVNDPAHGLVCVKDMSYGSCPDGRVVEYDPDVGFDAAVACYVAPVVAEARKFPTMLLVGGGVAALALLWFMRK